MAAPPPLPKASRAVDVAQRKQQHRLVRRLPAIWILEQFFPELLALVQRLASKTGKRIHVRGQWDNATPHLEKMLLQLIVELFGQYGWEWTTQPPNTPLANVDDAAIFPAIAKDVTSLGGMTNGGRYLQCEQL